MTLSRFRGRVADFAATAALLGAAGAASAQTTAPATTAPATSAPATTAPAAPNHGTGMAPGMAMPSAKPSAPNAVPSSTTTSPAEAGKPAPAVGNPTFPNAVDSKYSSLKGAKAIQKTCLDQYNANKKDPASGTNGGLKWIQKGGGYYSACTKHLKTASK